ncbi:IucA/IucC family protein [Fictibacillus terranigra]|uniref:IucA/IucC family protein n=1 Tax=Fictibacillus terranigra TaxID=3058424 RepID=A0ABT8E7T2_9BACL|nr:IucA/IucC family protein [Fictibacillus sp. CENA-BCM004]MDN4073976.1 IucA/IucC family protein [Fictibacillus sp. CENA-BCM004]
MNSKIQAEQATIKSFLNCFLRETRNAEGKPANGQLILTLHHQNIELIIPVKYWSPTGRHLFTFPIMFRTKGGGKPITADYLSLATLISKELLLQQGRDDAEDELVLRVIMSCRSMKDYIEKRIKDAGKLTEKDFTFIEAEQSLLLGHLMHPTPKSKQGMSSLEERIYTPELKGEFPLHFFKVHRSLVLQDSSAGQSAEEIVRTMVLDDPSVPHEFVMEHCMDEAFCLIPAHPLQARELVKQPAVQQFMKRGDILDIGAAGSSYSPTSSLRTVYNKVSRYMFKFSVPVKITNSLRANKPKELERGVEISRLLKTGLGEELNKRFPAFQIIKDPAYLNVNTGEEETGFEVVIRENPFCDNEKDASLIAGLCQDHPYGGESRLYTIIKAISEKENRSMEEVSEEWFQRYLSLALEPMLWLYEHYGLALEAHQQNSIIQLENGFPAKFYYRDNQGYYYAESKAHMLRELLPDLSEKSETVCSDAVADERLRYYLFFNHLFGLINGFGTAGLADEEKLLEQLRISLKTHAESAEHSGTLLKSLLHEQELPCKANLLTRLYDKDELIGSLEDQSVYVNVPNPIFQKEGMLHGV